MDRPEIEANIAEIRRAEMARAAEILGVEQHWLGFVDSGLPEGDPMPPLPEGCFALVAGRGGGRAAGPRDPRVPAARDHHLRRERRLPAPGPHLTHEVERGAFDAAADPDAYPDAGEPWQPLKLYYFVGLPRGQVHGAARGDAPPRPGVAVHRRSSRNGQDRAKRRSGEWTEPDITTRVPCGDYFEIRDEALLAHATQVDPDGFWFRCPLEVQQAAWPTEDYHLARSVVDSELPEDDLFAGVRETVCL